MPTLPNQIKIAELDYNQILTNLVEFMKVDPAFADYDFSGSGLRVLARVLAYVTFYQNYYLTAAVNESFLDTAQLRSSVASHARMLGYTLHGTQGARFYANVSVQLDDSSALSIVLPKRTQFVHLSNNNVNFYSLDDTILTQNSTSLLYEAPAVQLTEGRPLEYRFTVDVTDPTQRFVIPNANIDYTTVDVQVQQSVGSNVITQFTRASDLLTLTPTDNVFFVQEAFDGFPELKFGNDVVGAALDNGNIVIASYYICTGEVGNNIRGPFRIPAANIAGFVTGSTTADSNTVPSMGGTDTESLDNARFLAPLVYQTQNRCVTAQDYKTIILQTYGDQIGAINVFGGEEGDPNDPQNRPIFGHVFVALKPSIGQRFTDVIRTTIEDTLLKPRSIVGVIPQVIDPDYVYLNISTSVRYDPKATTRTKSSLRSAITDSIITYTQENIEKFDTSFRFSKFIRVIDDTDDAITGSSTRIGLEQRIFPVVNQSNQYVLKFNSPLRKTGTESAILEATSRRFTYVGDDGVTYDNCFFYESGGFLQIAHRNTAGAIAVVNQNIGSVNISTGLITISNFIPTFIENDEIFLRIQVIPTVNDFIPRLNQLFTLDETSGISIQLLNDATATLADQQLFFNGGIV
jgi:hypothetical protein